MSLESHLVELQKRHSDLEQQIDQAMSSPSIDDVEIAELKRRKLALKDEIFRLRSPAEKQTHH